MSVFCNKCRHFDAPEYCREAANHPRNKGLVRPHPITGVGRPMFTLCEILNENCDCPLFEAKEEP